MDALPAAPGGRPRQSDSAPFTACVVTGMLAEFEQIKAT